VHARLFILRVVYACAAAASLCVIFAHASQLDAFYIENCAAILREQINLSDACIRDKADKGERAAE
jgi:hypothetical protein